MIEKDKIPERWDFVFFFYDSKIDVQTRIRVATLPGGTVWRHCVAASRTPFVEVGLTLLGKISYHDLLVTLW